MAKPIIVVFGATGQQGGGVVDELLKDGKFAVRAITRDPSKPSAKKLEAAGAETVAADQSDQASVSKALEGAYGVFCVTNFWDPSCMGKELQVGTQIVKAAKDAGVKVFLWSTLADVQEGSGGKWDVPHFTDKAKVDAVVKDAGFEYFTFLMAPCYLNNIPDFGWAKAREDGAVVFHWPMNADTRMPGGDPRDMGKAVVAALKDAAGPKSWKGKHVAVTAYDQPVSTWLKDFEKVTGKKAVLQTQSHEDALKGGAELANMFAWFRDFQYYGDVDPSSGVQLVGEGVLTTWPEYLRKTGFAG